MSLNYNAIIFGSGSEKGFLLIGAIFALHTKKSLMSINHIVGISVGAILGTLLALGLTLPEIIFESLTFNLFDSWADLLREFDISKALNRANPRNFGLIDPIRIRERIEFWQYRKHRQSLTFLDLYLLTGKKLTIVSTDARDLNNPTPIYYDYEKTPNYLISQAVVDSCLLPGIFENKSPWKIDGVFSDPLPIEQTDTDNKTTLAFLLQDRINDTDNSIASVVLMIYRSLMVPIQIMVNQKLGKCSERVKVIKLFSDKKAPLSLNPSKNEKISMITEGFFQTWNNIN